MQNTRFIPPLNFDRAIYQYDSPSGKAPNTNTKYVDGRNYGSSLNIRGLSTATSSPGLIPPVQSFSVAASPRAFGSDISPSYLSGEKNQTKSKKIWKLFTRKAKMDSTRSENHPSESTTYSQDNPIKKHKSTPHLKGSRPDLTKGAKANPRYAPYHGFPPVLENSSNAIRSSSERDTTEHPKIIFVIDESWDASSADVPFQRVQQTIPVDVTNEECSEPYSHPGNEYQHTPQHHPIRGQRRRAETSKSTREKWFKKHTHDPDASFLDMDVKTKSKPFWN